MQDPHVVALHYEVGTGDGISFGNPADLSFTNHLGAFELAKGHLIVRPHDHFADGTQARAVIDPFLRAWEVETDLKRNIGSIRFKQPPRVEKIDRAPPLKPRAGTATLSVGVAEILAVGHVVSLHITQNAYPPPPDSFRTTPEVETAYARWQAFRQGREPLPAMAYAVLTLLQSQAGGRSLAATTFHIDRLVLDTIGQFSSTKGDGTTARKFAAGKASQPLTGAESTWLEAAIRQIIIRMGAHAAGVSLTPLTMTDLPSL